MKKISAVIITYNEEKNIERCLRSLQGVADEILVVDSYSTDATKSICATFGVRFLQHPFEGHIQQKNYAMAQAQYNWVLSLDADEVLSEALQQSILSAKQQKEGWAGAKMNRLSSYCGHWIRHCGWYPDRKLRLWNREKGEWGGENPHDKVVMQEGTSTILLKGDLLHYTYHTLSEHIRQMDKFSEIAAQEAYRKGKKVFPLWDLWLYPSFVFFKMFILKRGFLDGYYGWIVCKNGAYYRFLKYLKLNELYRQEKGN